MEIKVHKPFCLSFIGIPTSLKILCDNVSGAFVLSESLNKLISLVRTKVDEALLNTMIRFYDPLLHYFTYRDFQLVPTLEEFSSILGLPVLIRCLTPVKKKFLSWKMLLLRCICLDQKSRR